MNIGKKRKPLYHIAAISICIVLIFMTIVTIQKYVINPELKMPNGLDSEKQNPDLPNDSSLGYNRVGTDGAISGSYARDYTFKELCSVSDAVVDLTITERIGEDNEGMPKTFFKAKINKSFKGIFNEGDEILLRQDGSGKMTMEGFPLFTIGDRIISFLFFSNEFNYFFLINGDLYFCDVIEYEKQIYALKRMSDFEDINFETNITDELKLNIREHAKEKDALLSDSRLFNQIFLYDDFIKTLEGNINE